MRHSFTIYIHITFIDASGIRIWNEILCEVRNITLLFEKKYQ